MLKKLLYGLLTFPYRFTQMHVEEKDRDNIRVSWSATLKQKNIVKTYGFLIMYAQKNCLACTEIKAWLDFYMIPHTYIECSVERPMIAPRFRLLADLRGYVCRDRQKKMKDRLFLAPVFPQLEFCKFDNQLNEYQWNKRVGNSKILRAFVEEKIEENQQDFPGFERGVYGDKIS